MLTFFRKIRKSIIDSSSARKYLLYAIGEILLVMIGILLALQVNNWNERRHIQNQVSLQLVNLKSAIQSDIESYDNLLMIEGFRFHAVKYLLEMAGESIKYYDGYLYNQYPTQWDLLWTKPIPEDYDRAFVEVCFAILDMGPTGSIVNNSAIQEFGSSGLFSALKNAQLKMKINDYYRRANTEHSGKSWDYKLELTLSVLELLANKYQIDVRRMENVKDPIGVIRENKPIIIKFQALIDNISFSCQQFMNSRKMAEEVISTIDRFLGETE